MRGCQQPRISLTPPYVSSAGQEAIDVYSLAGGELFPWQQAVLHQAMGEREDGRWTAFEVGLVVARQNGKDEILCARELWGLFVGGERLLIHSAHKFDTAMEHMDRLFALIDAVPEFRKRLAPRQPNRAHGKEGIRLKNGARIRFRARTRSGGGRGFTGDCVIFNEAMDLPDEIVGHIEPTMSARSMGIPGPQMLFAGSAVDQETMANGLVLARIREAAIAGNNDRLAYFEWSAPDDADPTDWEARAQANPSLGYTISAEHIETEFQSPSMSPRQFLVERMGVGDWPDTSEAAGRAINWEDWDACAELDSSKRIAGRCFFAVDTSPEHAWGSIGVAGQRADGLFHVAVVHHARGTDWIVDRCLELRRERPGSRFVLDPGGPAGNLIGDFKRAGIPVIELTTRDYADACASFLDAIPDGLRHPEGGVLDEAVAAVRKQPMGDRWKWSRKDSTSGDISPVVAVTLALWAADRKRGTAEVVSLADVLEDGDVLIDPFAPDVELVPVLSVGPQDLLVDTLEEPEALERVCQGAARLLRDPSTPDGLLELDGYYVLRVTGGSPLMVAQQIRAFARVLGALRTPFKEEA